MSDEMVKVSGNVPSGTLMLLYQFFVQSPNDVGEAIAEKKMPRANDLGVTVGVIAGVGLGMGLALKKLDEYHMVPAEGLLSAEHAYAKSFGLIGTYVGLRVLYGAMKKSS